MTEHYLDILARTIRENWEQPALTDFYLTEDGTAQDTSRGNRYTYGEMYCEMMRLGELFRALGLKQGDHIAICGSNSANWAVAYLAIAAYQGVAVTVLHSQNIEDIAHQIDFSDAVCLFTDKDIWEELKQQSLPQVRYIISLEDFTVCDAATGRAITCYGSTGVCKDPTPIPDYRDTIGIPNGYDENTLREKLSNGNLSNSQLSNSQSLDDLAMICFTSGSSGVSKGVMKSYKSVSGDIKTAVNLYPVVNNSHYYSTLPFIHTAGLVGELFAQLMLGKHIFIDRDLSSIKKYVCSIEFITPYMIIMVPQVLQKVFGMYYDNFIKNLSQYCKLIVTGTAKWDEDTEKEIEKSGIPFCTGYGQTEAGVNVSIDSYLNHRLGSSGKIVKGTSIKFVKGEICIKSKTMMLGYYKDPEATAKKIDKDGWLHTGDAGYMDEDGYLYVTGRIGQDMIVLPNGENIHPEDIEQKLNALPEVRESLVLARNGKLIALIVPEQGIAEQGVYQPYMADIRRSILRTANPQLPMYSQLCDIEFLDKPLERTAKQTIKRYLYV